MSDNGIDLFGPASPVRRRLTRRAAQRPGPASGSVKPPTGHGGCGWRAGRRRDLGLPPQPASARPRATATDRNGVERQLCARLLRKPHRKSTLISRLARGTSDLNASGMCAEILDELDCRGLIAQSTDLDALATETRRGPMTVYAGFDPTAPSLHAGHLVPLLALRRFRTCRPSSDRAGQRRHRHDRRSAGHR